MDGSQDAFDVFISHASEDKPLVDDLYKELSLRGLRVWFDRFEIRLADSLRRRIDDGLTRSRYGVVILSPAFFTKEWPQAELDALFALEVLGQNVIIPIVHDLGSQTLARHSPLLAGRRYVSTRAGVPRVAQAIVEKVRGVSAAQLDSGAARTRLRTVAVAHAIRTLSTEASDQDGTSIAECARTSSSTWRPTTCPCIRSSAQLESAKHKS